MVDNVRNFWWGPQTKSLVIMWGLPTTARFLSVEWSGRHGKSYLPDNCLQRWNLFYTMSGWPECAECLWNCLYVVLIYVIYLFRKFRLLDGVHVFFCTKKQLFLILKPPWLQIVGLAGMARKRIILYSHMLGLLLLISNSSCSTERIGNTKCVLQPIVEIVVK